MTPSPPSGPKHGRRQSLTGPTMTVKSVLPSQPAGSVAVVNQKTAVAARPRRQRPSPSPSAERQASHNRASTPEVVAQDSLSGMSSMLSSLESTADFMKELKRKSYQKKPREENKPRPSRRSMPAAPVPEPVPQLPEVDISSFQNRVAQELSILTSTANDLVSKLSRFQPGEIVLKKLCTRFRVADLVSDQSSTVQFYTDRAEYNFQNEKVGGMRMVMYYKDTKDIRCSRSDRTLSFHVFNPLEHFSSHYNHEDVKQRILIQFSSRAEIMEVERVAVPLLMGAGK